MTILEATRTDADNTASPRKGYVVKSGKGYRAEQGSDYEPGVSAETVGAKSIWLGRISLPPGKRTRASGNSLSAPLLAIFVMRQVGLSAKLIF